MDRIIFVGSIVAPAYYIYDFTYAGDWFDSLLFSDDTTIYTQGLGLSSQ